MEKNDSKMKKFIFIIFDVIEEVVSFIIVAGILIYAGYLQVIDQQSRLDAFVLLWGILAIVTLVAVSNLRDRLLRFRRIERHTEVTKKKLEEHVFDPIRAENFFQIDDGTNSEIFTGAKKIFISGITLVRTTGKFHETLKQSIIDGANVKIIILDITSDAINQLELRSWGEIEPEYYQNRIRSTISLIKVIGANLNNIPNAKGSLEIGYLPFVPSFGVILIDPEQISGMAYIKIYHHLTDDKGPKYKINLGRDPYWFKFFHKQMEKMWKNCSRVDTIYKA